MSASAPEFVPGGGGGGGQPMMIATNMYQTAAEWSQHMNHGPQPPPSQPAATTPTQFNQPPQVQYTPYVPQSPNLDVQSFAMQQRMAHMSINSRLHQYNPQSSAPTVNVILSPQAPPPQNQQPTGFNQVRVPGTGVGVGIGGGVTNHRNNKPGRASLGHGSNQNFVQQVSNGGGNGMMSSGGYQHNHARQRGRNGGGNSSGSYNQHHNHHTHNHNNKNTMNAVSHHQQQQHHLQHHQSSQQQSDGMNAVEESYTPSEPEDAALSFLSEVIANLEDSPGLFETYQKKLKEMFYDLANNNFVMSNSLEMIFKQSAKSQNFRYMGARLCNLLDELEPSEDSLLRGLLRLKMNFEMQELVNFMQNETHTVRGTTLFMAELFMQLRRPSVSIIWLNLFLIKLFILNFCLLFVGSSSKQ